MYWLRIGFAGEVFLSLGIERPVAGYPLQTPVRGTSNRSGGSSRFVQFYVLRVEGRPRSFRGQQAMQQGRDSLEKALAERVEAMSISQK